MPHYIKSIKNTAVIGNLFLMSLNIKQEAFHIQKTFVPSNSLKRN